MMSQFNIIITIHIYIKFFKQLSIIINTKFEVRIVYIINYKSTKLQQIMSMQLTKFQQSILSQIQSPLNISSGFQSIQSIFSLNKLANQTLLELLIRNKYLQNIIQEKLKVQLYIKALILNQNLLKSQHSLIQHSPVKIEEVKIQNDNGISTQTKLILKEEYHSHQKSYEPLEKNAKEPIKLTKGKNQTKNIPKNYGKAIASFIQKNEPLVRRILTKFPKIQYYRFIQQIKKRRKNINSIAGLRSFWLESQNQYAAPTRILSQIFLRKHSLPYIFNSRVINYLGHIKYRQRMIEVVKDPSRFTNIKMY